MNDTNQTRSLEDHVVEIKRQKEKEQKEATEKLDIHKKNFEESEQRAGKLLTELFDIQNVTLDKVQEIIKELKQLTEKRINLSMSIYEYETKLNELKYI